MQTHSTRRAVRFNSTPDAYELGNKLNEVGTTDRTWAVPSTAAVAGHPIHPMLVPLPITLLISAFATDIVTWWTGDPFWARAGLWLTGAGVVLGLITAIPGLIDFTTIRRVRSYNIAWIHGIGNVIVIILAAVSWILRFRDPVGAVLPWGITLSALTTIILAVTGWLGGELSYRHRVGVMLNEEPEK